MANMHLIKLCVGIDSVEELAAWQAMRLEKLRNAGLAAELVHRTRQMPRQRDAVVKSGSLYWVIKGFVRCRQRIADLREETDAEGRALCGIVFAHDLIVTRPQPRRPFQGWRYLKADDAPPDIGPAGSTMGDDMPESMRAELAALALL
jgi:hypothetical protein